MLNMTIHSWNLGFLNGSSHSWEQPTLRLYLTQISKECRIRLPSLWPRNIDVLIFQVKNFLFMFCSCSNEQMLPQCLGEHGIFRKWQDALIHLIFLPWSWTAIKYVPSPLISGCGWTDSWGRRQVRVWREPSDTWVWLQSFRAEQQTGRSNLSFIRLVIMALNFIC